MLLLVPQIGIMGAAIVFLLSPTSQAIYLTLYVKRWKKNKQ
jgi:O-antigen/teichoic acid export membrane protein